MRINLAFRVTLICDAPNCDDVGPKVRGYWGLQKRARACGALFGWTYIEGAGDFCPKHSRATELPEEDITVCPGCDGYADNGFTREEPPSPYYCSKCDPDPRLTGGGAG